MGCDIHIVAQKRTNGAWVDVEGSFSQGPDPFDWRTYGMFGFLADVRNYSAVPPIAQRRGVPDDFGWTGDNLLYCQDLHSHSWLTVQELAAFDYDQPVEDRRVTGTLPNGMTSGACTAPAGDGKTMTWREFLGPQFMSDLAELQRIGAERIVFAFDS